MAWEDDDSVIYKVVMNHEEQYSIWPADKENPLGWTSVGKSGPKKECLAYIEEVWTDMRPLSLRKKMEEAARQPPPPPAAVQAREPEESLVSRLSRGEHAVEVSLRPEANVAAFKAAIDRNYVHIKFTGTRGGTELGVRLDRAASNLTGADFDNAKGSVHLEGGLTLDYVPVRCIADINLESLSGSGRLERVERTVDADPQHA
jgi:uncharacterized protein YbdZ (MbtH family)